MPRKSPKRVAAGKKARRTFLRNMTKKKSKYAKRRKVVRRKNPVKRKRRRNPTVKSSRSGGSTTYSGTTRRQGKSKMTYKPTAKRKSAKRVAAGKKAARTRKANLAKKRKPATKKRKTTIRKKGKKTMARRKGKMTKARRSRIMKAVWRKRRKGGLVRKGTKRRTTYRVKSGKRRGKTYKRSKTASRGKRRGSFVAWRNPGAQGFLKMAGIVAGGYFLSRILYKFTAGSAAAQGMLAKSPAIANLAPVVVPMGLGFLMATWGAKKAPAKWKGLVGNLGIGVAIAGMIGAIDRYIIPRIGAETTAKLGLSGYTTSPFSGYVPAGMSGYTRSMGQMEERYPGDVASLGASVEYRGTRPAGLLGPARKGLDYSASAVKPYGLGVPRESRRYNNYTFGGVYDTSVYET